MWAFADPAFRNGTGTLTAAVCFPLACAAAALIVAAAPPTLTASAGWLALAVVGQAASLQLIDAGPTVHYQHYRPLATLASTHPWLLALVTGQAIVVFVAAGRRLSGWPALPINGPRVWQLSAATLLSVSTAATVSPDVMRYATELAFAASVQLAAIATVVLSMLALPESLLADVRHRVDGVLGSDENRRPARRDRLAWSAAGIATLLAATLNVASYERHPHLPDEVADLYHARYFSAGMLTMPAPPSMGGFDLDLMTYQPDRWFSPVAPGWPAMLAVGVLAGVPWMVNPVLAGIDVLLAFMLLDRLYGRRVARMAAVLLAVSPWFLFLGMSFMTHTFTLTLALAAALALERARRTEAPGLALLSGAAVGAASLVRPLDGLLIGISMTLWAATSRGARLRLMTLVGCGAAAVGALVLPYNHHLIGNVFEFPLNAYLDAQYHPNANAYGFGPDRGMGWPIDPNVGHSPLDGVINTNLNVFSLNTDLFGWSTGSLIFAALFLCAGRFSRLDWLMLTVIATVVAAHFFYYFSGGPDFGARYWFLIVVPLVVLTARGIELTERLAGPRAVVAAAALIVIASINYVPWRAVDKYHHYRRMRPDMRMLAAEHQFGRDLVLIRGNRFPDYASAAIENPIDLSSDSTIYAWDRSLAVRAELLRAYPDRRVWFVDGPSITGSGFRVASGPLQAESLLATTP
jgi:hypothetical protein